LVGTANIANFPNRSDYRNLQIAESVKTLGYINKFNFGIITAKKYLLENNNPEPIFDLSLGTAFKVTIPINTKWKIND